MGKIFKYKTIVSSITNSKSSIL